MSSPDNPHGILGHWAVVGHGFNIASIISSGLVIGSFIWACLHDRGLYRRRISFRMAAWIAACDTIYSVCQLCVFNNNYMSTRSEINLRVIHWLMSASILSFAFLSACVGIQLVLNVLSKNSHISNHIYTWYEFVSLFLGFFITHPFLYLYETVQWAPQSQAFHVITELSYYRLTSWLTMWVWLTMCCVFLMVVGILVFLKMYTEFGEFSKNARLPEGSDKHFNDSFGHNVHIDPVQARKIRSVTTRILLYSTIPIFTQVWVLVANMLTQCPMWLYILGNLIPATQGMINLLVYLTNPAWDEYRHRLANRYRRLRAKSDTTAISYTDERLKADDETICQSIKIEK